MPDTQESAMVNEWDGLSKQAMKILGEKGKVPKWSATIDLMSLLNYKQVV